MRLIDGDAKALDGDGVLRTHIDVALVCADRIARDGHGFQHTVGVALEDGTVHERAGVALVGVAADVLDVALRGLGKRPLSAGGEARAAPAAQAGGEHLVDDVVGRHGGEDLFERGIVARRDGFLDVLRRDEAAVAEGDTHLLLIEGRLAEGDDAAVLVHGALIEELLDDVSAFYKVLFDDGLGVLGRHLGIEGALGIDDHDGAEGAEAEAARLDDDDVVDVVLFEGGLELLDDLHRVRGGAARTAADEHLLAVLRMLCDLFRLFLYGAADGNEVVLARADLIELRGGDVLVLAHTFSSLRYLSRMSFTDSGVSLPYTSSPIIMTGARPHAPTHRQLSTEKSPSSVHSPHWMPSSVSISERILSDPFT